MYNHENRIEQVMVDRVAYVVEEDELKFVREIGCVDVVRGLNLMVRPVVAAGVTVWDVIYACVKYGVIYWMALQGGGGRIRRGSLYPKKDECIPIVSDF